MHSAIRRAVLFVILLLLPGTARADLPSDAPLARRDMLRFDWVGSSGCRPTRDVFEGLRRLLGGDPNQILTQELVVRADVEELSHGWTLTLSGNSSNGPVERQLTVPHCSEVAQAAALVISLWIQSPSVQVPDRAPFREGTDESGAIRRLSEIEPDTPNRASRNRARSRVRLRRDHFGAAPGRSFHGHFALGMTALAGALPSPSWGLTGRAGVALGAWRIEGLFLWLDKRQILAPASPSLGGQFGLLASGMRIAYALPVTAFLNVQPGLWSLIGRLHGDGLGTLTRSTPSNDGWGAAGLGLEANLSIGHVSLSLGGGNGLPFGRPRFFVGDTLLYQTPPVTWFAHFLGAVAFP